MWVELWQRHRGVVVGIAGGIFHGFIYLLFGFWDMLVFGFLVFLGYYFGRAADRQEASIDIAAIYRRLLEKWKMFR